MQGMQATYRPIQKQYIMKVYNCQDTAMKSFQFVTRDELGIHARSAGLLAKPAKEYKDTVITVTKAGNTVKAPQLMKLMSLTVKQGDEVTVAAEGPEEEAAIERLEAFFQENF